MGFLYKEKNMTALTLNLSDNLVEQAKSKGVFNEILLKELATQFLTAKILETLLPASNNQKITHKKPSKTWEDYFNERDLSAVPDDFMEDRQQPPLENRNLFSDD